MTDRNSVDIDAKVFSFPNPEDTEQQATIWFAKLNNEDVPQAEIEAFREWFNQSARHRAAYAQIERIWGEAGVLEELKDQGKSVLGLDSRTPAFFPRRRAMALAASIVLALVGGGVYSYQKHLGLHQSADYATSVGLQDAVALSDGSTIQMNTDTKINVHFTPKTRTVFLRKGEAHFDVSSDRNREFTVVTDAGRVTAVGTAFAIRVHPKRALEVTVSEGRVSLAPNDAESVENHRALSGPPRATELTAGQSALFDGGIERIEHFSEVDLRRKLFWREGMLAYSGETLEYVIADISRYTAVSVEIEDPELRDLRIRGLFKVGEVEALFETLELTFGLTVERIDDERVLISGAS